MQKMDGMNYAPVSRGKVRVVCGKDEFPFGVIGLDHGHIYAMCNGLLEAGATLTKVYDSDASKAEAFQKLYPQVQIVSDEKEILDDPDIRMVVSAIVPCKRAALGMEAMRKGKDFFADKPGMLKEEEIQQVEACCRETQRKYVIYYGERVHVEGAVYAQQLIEKGEIGRVLHLTILAPHRLNKETRPEWFFDPQQNGPIITDIGSHQIEQFLSFTGAKTARVMHSTVANYHNKEKQGFYDYGDGNLVADNGATCFFRVDWHTPAGLGAWGDGRVFIIGTKGTIEIRKYIDVACSNEGDHVFLVNQEGEHRYQVTGKTGFVFFGQLILDCLNRTEEAITQEHTLEAMRITLKAQQSAEIVER